MKKISIIGLGQIGLQLATSLKNQFEVLGTIHSSNKLIDGIQTISYDSNTPVPDELEADITILTIPPSGLSTENFPKFKTRWLIYTSSISVYGNVSGNIDEKTSLNPLLESEIKQSKIESLVMNNSRWTILRLGGLIGQNRHPGNYLAGKQNLPNPHHPVNLIHHDDVVQIILKIIEKEKYNEIYNCVCDEHHSRREFYTAFAKKHSLVLPDFLNEDESRGKLVLNDKIKQHLGIEFIYSELIEKLP